MIGYSPRRIPDDGQPFLEDYNGLARQSVTQVEGDGRRVMTEKIGNTVHIRVLEQSGASVRAVVSEIFNDYYRFSIVSGGDVYVAKHFKLRHVLANYQQLTSLVTVDTQTAIAENLSLGIQETWEVTPKVYSGDEFYVRNTGAPTGVTRSVNGQDVDVTWVVAGEEPDWAVQADS